MIFPIHAISRVSPQNRTEQNRNFIPLNSLQIKVHEEFTTLKKYKEKNHKGILSTSLL